MDCRKSLAIGPRTYKDILDGKKIRKHEDGAHVFDDYFTDTDSESSSSIHSDISSKKKTSRSEKKYASNLSRADCVIAHTQTKIPSEIAIHDSPAKSARESTRYMNSNFQMESLYNIAIPDCPAKNTRHSTQSLSPKKNSDCQIESPYKYAAQDSPCKTPAYYSLSKDTRFNRKSITSHLMTMKNKKDSENAPQSKSLTIITQTPNRNLDDVLAELAEDIAILSKTNDNLSSPESTSSISCTSKTFVKMAVNSETQKRNFKSTADDVMHSNMNVFKTKILDDESEDLSDATEARLEIKKNFIPEIVNTSSAVTEANILAASNTGTETALQPNKDKDSNSKFSFIRNLSLLPCQTAMFLKERSRKSVRITRSFKHAEIPEDLEQFDEYDAKIMQMIQTNPHANSSHKFLKESTVKAKQINSVTGVNPKICVKKSKPVGGLPNSHKKANIDLNDKSYISEQVVASDKNEQNFELLNDEQNMNDTLPVIVDKHPLNNNHAILKSVENKSLTSKNCRNVSNLKKSKQKISKKNISSKANEKFTDLSGSNKDESLINFNQLKTSNPASTHEMPPIDTISESNSPEENKQFDSENDKSKLISQTFTRENRTNKSKYKNGIKKHKSRVNKINTVTSDCEIDNFKAPLENTINKHSPKKRKITDHKQNNTVGSINNHYIQDKESSDLELDRENSVSLIENIDTNVSNELRSAAVVLSENGFATDVPKIGDFDTSMSKVTKKQDHGQKKTMHSADHADKRYSAKRKNQSKNAAQAPIRKATKRLKLTKKKAEKDTYNFNKQCEHQKVLSENNNNIRRSTRTKYPPLASWKNERLLYGFKNGEVEIFGLDPGSKGTDYFTEEQIKKNYFGKSISNKKRIKIIKPKKAKIIDPVLQKEMTVDLLKKFDLIPWHVPDDSMNNKKSDYRIKKTFEAARHSFGFIEIPVGKEKPPQYIPEEEITLTMFRGNIEIVIQENSYTLYAKDTIVVPRGSAYSLKNVGNVSVLIHFVVGRFRIANA